MSGVEVRDNTVAALRLILRAVDEGLREATMTATAIATNSMPGAGAMEIVTTTGRLAFVPSNPGQPPGTRTGVLKASMGFERVNQTQWRFGTNIRYGLYNEMSMGVPPRPFLLPVINKKGARLERAFADAATKRLKMGTGARNG